MIYHIIHQLGIETHYMCTDGTYKRSDEAVDKLTFTNLPDVYDVILTLDDPILPEIMWGVGRDEGRYLLIEECDNLNRYIIKLMAI